MSLNDVSGLQVDQDMDHQRRWWRIQRKARYTLGALLVAAALGVFGHGPLASARAGGADGPFEVEYERLVRHSTNTQVAFRVMPGTDKQASIWINDGPFDEVQVLRIVPEPDRREAGSDRIVYHFPTTEAGQPVTIRFDLQHSGYGPVEFRAGVPGGGELAWTTFVLP